jgi:hypothetical protein
MKLCYAVLVLVLLGSPAGSTQTQVFDPAKVGHRSAMSPPSFTYRALVWHRARLSLFFTAAMASDHMSVGGRDASRNGDSRRS